MRLTKLLLVATLFTIIPGQLIRLSLFNAGAVTLSDFFVLITLTTFLAEKLFNREKIDFPKNLSVAFVFFLISASIANVFSLNFLTIGQSLEGTFLFLRFVAYFLLSIVTYNVVSNNFQKWVKAMLVSGFIFTLLGVFQFFVFPDLGPFAQYGWDPHISRLFSSTLDPNFTGGIITILFALSLSSFLFDKKISNLALSIFFLVAIIMTFSRSSYLALTVTAFAIGAVKSIRIAILTIVVFAVLLVIVPQARSRVIGAFTIDETAAARIESWQKATTIFSSSPILGVGFNNYRIAQAREGFFGISNPTGGHSGSGSDSSVMTIIATTGVVGLFFFSFFIFQTLKILRLNSKKSAIALASFSSFLGILFHSQFVNSFFYPQFMLIIWFLVGLKIKSDN